MCSFDLTYNLLYLLECSIERRKATSSIAVSNGNRAIEFTLFFNRFIIIETFTFGYIFVFFLCSLLFVIENKKCSSLTFMELL